MTHNFTFLLLLLEVKYKNVYLCIQLSPDKNALLLEEGSTFRSKDGILIDHHTLCLSTIRNDLFGIL